MSKYLPLHEHLADLKISEWNATFSDVEKIIDGLLPKSAYDHQAWWANNPTGHSHAKSWVEAGWKTEDVNLSGRRLVFRRVKSGANSPSHPTASPYGFMAGSAMVLKGADLTQPIDADWNE